MPAMLAEIETATAGGTDRYLLPLGYIREEDIVTAMPQQLALARARRGRFVGLLTDAFVLDSFSFVITAKAGIHVGGRSGFPLSRE